METQKKDKKKIEHVALSESSIYKINRWFEQVNAKKKIRLSRKDLINWFIEKTPDTLSSSDLNAIIETFYDDEAYLRQLLRDVKKARAEGNVDALDLIVRQKRQEPKKDQSNKKLPVQESNPS